jgi:hypothetical protein
MIKTSVSMFACDRRGLAPRLACTDNLDRETMVPA